MESRIDGERPIDPPPATSYRGFVPRAAISAAASDRRTRVAERNGDHQRQAITAARSEVRRGHQGEGNRIQTVVAAAGRAAQGRAQRPAYHDRRLRLRSAEHVRRRRADACPRPRCEERAAVHAVSLHVPLLADAGGADHRAQPPRGRLRRRGRGGHGLSRLRFRHPQGMRHDRRNPQGKRVRDLVVRQGPQYAILPVEPGGAV